MTWFKIIAGVLIVGMVVGITLFFTLRYLSTGWCVLVWLVMVALLQFIIAMLVIYRQK